MWGARPRVPRRRAFALCRCTRGYIPAPLRGGDGGEPGACVWLLPRRRRRFAAWWANGRGAGVQWGRRRGAWVERAAGSGRLCGLKGGCTMVTPKRVRLAEIPTPLVRLERLSAELGGAEVWLKRDDLTGLEVSGNKVRKLEFVVADALAGGCDTLVTEGTAQSNHCRATAAVCARLGLGCVLLFRPGPQDGPPVGNHLLDVLFGAQTRHFTRAEYSANRTRIVADVLAELRAGGRVPRFTPAGASEPVGCWGYIEATRELAEQTRAAGLGACDVVAGVSSGGTFAGMVLGKKLYREEELHLVGVPVSDDVAHHRAAIAELCGATIAKYGLDARVEPAELAFLDGYVGEGYAIPYDEELAGLRLLARTEGVVLDPVYTGKAFCGLLAEVRAGRLGRSRPVVFVHTGGIFSDFAWPELVAGRGRVGTK